MATKYECSKVKEKQKDSVHSKFDNQNINLNLNNQKHEYLEALPSSYTTKDNTKDPNYDILRLNDLRAQKDLNSWKKSDNNSSTTFLNSNQNSEKNDELKKSTSTINSTLSLHITAYENFTEAKNDLKSNEKELEQSKGECLDMAKKWKTSNHFVDGTTSIIQKPFEFPRQQEDEGSRPELMAFTASQRLLNPNQMDENNQIQPPPGDPNKTVLLQGEDGKTQVFVNNDEHFVRSHYLNGKSFEDIGDGKNKIEFELPFRLHKDSTSLISTAGGNLSPALPAITYHNHVWWFWTYELSFRDVGGVIKVSFTLKSIGPAAHPTIDLPRGALGENIPRTQMAPNLQNPILRFGEKTFKLSTILGTPDRSYFIADFVTLDEFKANFTEETPFLSLNVSLVIPVSYFDVESLAGLSQPITDIVPKGVGETLEKIINGEKVNGADFVLTFGDSSKNDSVEFYVHRAALARTSSTLGQLFVNKVNPPGDQILVPTAENRFIFPHLRPQDARFFLTYFYTQQITLPHFGAFARVGRVFCMIAARPQVFHLFKQWQRLLVENLLNAKKNTKESNLVIEESVKALIGIYSAPYGGLPVAKRVASSLLANKMSQWESESKNLVTSLREDPNFKDFDLEKFLPGVVRLQHFISAVKKNGI